MKKPAQSLKEVGYLDNIPANHHKSEYEKITITKNGNTKHYYRKKSKTKKYNKITNFNTALEEYNKYL